MLATLANAQARVEYMLDEGLPLEQIEAWIEDSDLTQEAKSALWLVAWVESDRNGRRSAVGELLAGTATTSVPRRPELRELRRASRVSRP
jgi:hypothetical protein